MCQCAGGAVYIGTGDTGGPPRYRMEPEMGRKGGWATVWEHICSPTLSPANTSTSHFSLLSPPTSELPALPSPKGLLLSGAPGSWLARPLSSPPQPWTPAPQPLHPYPQASICHYLCGLPSPPKVCSPHKAPRASVEEMGWRDWVMGVLV